VSKRPAERGSDAITQLVALMKLVAPGDKFPKPDVVAPGFAGWSDAKTGRVLSIVVATNPGFVITTGYAGAWPAKYMFVNANDGEFTVAWQWFTTGEEPQP